MSILKYIASKISIGSFTDSHEWEKQPFAQLSETRLQRAKNILKTRMAVAQVDLEIINLFDQAFDYFIAHPEKYDGTSGDVELHKIGTSTFDIGAILHDYLDAVNYTRTYENLKRADKLLDKVMNQLGDASFHRDKRMILLHIIKPLRYTMSKTRRNTQPKPSAALEQTVAAYVDGYSYDYSNFIKYTALTIALAVLLLTHPWLYKLVGLI